MRGQTARVTPEALALAAAILAGVPSLAGAACRGHAPDWDGGEDIDPIIPATICQAVSRAGAVPWRGVTWAPPGQRPLGVVAGQVRHDRRPAWVPIGPTDPHRPARVRGSTGD